MPEQPSRGALIATLIAELLDARGTRAPTSLGTRIAEALADAVAMAPRFAAGEYDRDTWIAHRVAMIEREERL